MLSFLKKCKKIILISLLLIIVGAGIFGFVGSRANIKTAKAQAGAATAPAPAVAPAQQQTQTPAKTDTKTEEKSVGDWLTDPSGTMLWLIGVVVSWIVWFLGGVLSALLMVLFIVARYNNFINSPAIVTGWVVIRDLCNIFFIVIFLVMVVSTVLDIEEYSYARILKKLLIMAVLINFSKLICGIFIDAAQVVMMAFMSSIGQLGAKYFVYMLGIDQILAKLSVVPVSGKEGFLTANLSTILMSYVLAVIYMIVTIATVLVLLVVLIQRVVMLWIYVVLSPAAYFLSTFPQGASYSGKWWSEFVKYVTIGPIVAFFLWLSFVSMGNTENQAKILKDMSKETTEETAYLEKDAISPQVGITEGGSPSHIVKFIIGIALLLGGLMAAQTIGGMAGNFAGATVKNLQTAGAGTLKGIGKAAAYLPKEYAKRAGYGVADWALGGLKKAPLISGFAIEKHAQLTQYREAMEEKKAKYIKYVDEPDLDRIIQNYTGRGRSGVGRAMSLLTRGKEVSKQAYERARFEKNKRGDEWGMSTGEKRTNKTQALIEGLRAAGHSVTANGEDAFRDAERGKECQEFMKKNIGMLDNDELRNYFSTVRGGRYTDEIVNARDASGNYIYTDDQGNQLRDAQNRPILRSEYFRERNVNQARLDNNGNVRRDAQGNIIRDQVASASPNMTDYLSARAKAQQLVDTHHENFQGVYDEANNRWDPNPVLRRVYLSRGGRKKLARVRDDGNAAQTGQFHNFLEQMLDEELRDLAIPQAQRQLPVGHNYDIANAFNAFRAPGTLNAGAGADVFINEMMHARGLRANLGIPDPIGNSRNVTGKSKSLEVKSGITGLDKIEKGRLAMNFSEIGLDNLDGLQVEGKDKAEIAKRIRESLSNVDENLAKSVEEKINGLSYLVLHNKEKDMSGRERRATHAHESLHARMSNAVSDDELRGVWNNSMDEAERGKAREKVKKVYGNDKMSEDAIMKEYFTEGLTNKTRWAVKDPEKKITLGKNAEQGLDTLLKSKGSNIEAFKSNITETRPNKENITQVMTKAVDGKSQDSLAKLAAAIENMGDGLNAISEVGGSVEDLAKAVYKNNTLLEKNAKEYRDNANKLNNLSRAEKFKQWRQNERNLSKLDKLSRKS